MGNVTPTTVPGAGRRSRAQALVEAALIFPLMLLLLLGLIDFGRAYYAGVALTAAAREGARLAIGPDQTDARVQQRVVEAAADAARWSGFTLTTADVVVTPAGSRKGKGGQPVTVTATTRVKFYTGFLTQTLGFDGITVRGKAEMMIL